MNDEETRLEAQLKEQSEKLHRHIDELVEKRAEEWLRNAKGHDWTNEFKKLFSENEDLKDELAIARERLGPAGYRIIEELMEARRVISKAKVTVKDQDLQYEDSSGALEDLKDSLEKYDAIRSGK